MAVAHKVDKFKARETFEEQIVAESSGCFICSAQPTIYMVKDRGYCKAHKKYAEDDRKRLARLVDSLCSE